MKKIGLIILLLVGLYIIFVTEEVIRLKNGGQHPLIIIRDNSQCDGDKIEHLEDYTTNCKSIGFRIEREYILDDSSDKDNLKFKQIREEIWIFGIISI